MRRGVLSSVLVLLGLAASGGAARVGAQDARAHVAPPARVKLLGLNDFHGQLEPGRTYQGRPVGSAAVLAAYLRASTAKLPGATLIVHAGDWVGASPPSSALLQDEPSIQWLNLLGNDFCRHDEREDPRCNLVGTPGNHEFDEGALELLRLVYGGRARQGDFLEHPYRGATFPYVCANVIDRRRGTTFLPAYVVKEVAGITLAVIGAVTEDTPTLVMSSGVRGLSFVDAAEAVNRQVRLLTARGIQAIIVAVHKGGAQEPYAGPTRPDVPGPKDASIVDFVQALDDAVDVVISGHAHAFTNALMRNKSGRAILVTQAGAAGMAFAEIDLALDPTTGDVVEKSASISPTWADAGPGLAPAADVAALVERARSRVRELTERVVARANATFADEPNAAGESALGNLIADAQRRAMRADIALMNQGGIRTELPAGDVTWGALFAVQPFSNALVSMELTGTQIIRALEHQWQRTPPHLLQVSGLSYVWDRTRPPGERVVQAQVGGRALLPNKLYRVVVNSFLAEGGNDFSVFREGKRRRVGPIDLDALAAYVKQQRTLTPRLDGRVRTQP